MNTLNFDIKKNMRNKKVMIIFKLVTKMNNITIMNNKISAQIINNNILIKMYNYKIITKLF